MLRMLRSGPVKVFGRPHDDPIRARRRQAYEKRQWTKSRDVDHLWAFDLLALDGKDLRSGRSRPARDASRLF
jgi:ATP-dependent DNA ligase